MPLKEKTVEDFNKIFKSEIPSLNNSELKKISKSAYKFSTDSSFQPKSSNLPDDVSSNKFYNILETQSKRKLSVVNNQTPVNNLSPVNNQTSVNNPKAPNNTKPAKELTPHEKFMKKFGKTAKPAKRMPWRTGKARGGKRYRSHRRTRRK
jgi:hypothetical protein